MHFRWIYLIEIFFEDVLMKRCICLPDVLCSAIWISEQITLLLYNEYVLSGRKAKKGKQFFTLDTAQLTFKVIFCVRKEILTRFSLLFGWREGDGEYNIFYLISSTPFSKVFSLSRVSWYPREFRDFSNIFSVPFWW